MAFEVMRRVRDRLSESISFPPTEAESIITQISTLVETKRQKTPDLLYMKNLEDTIPAFGFDTYITSTDTPPMYTTIFVSGDDLKAAVDVEVHRKGFLELHEIYRIESRGTAGYPKCIHYSRDEVTRNSGRWLSTDKKDRAALNHLKKLIRDVQNNNR